MVRTFSSFRIGVIGEDGGVAMATEVALEKKFSSMSLVMGPAILAIVYIKDICLFFSFFAFMETQEKKME